jgi:hypothetical protein
MHFVQIRFSGSVSGVYRLWKFENLADFRPPRRRRQLFPIFRARARQKFPLSRIEFFTAASKPPGYAYIYKAKLRNVVIPRREDVEGPPTNGRLGGKQPRVIHQAWERSLACARDDKPSIERHSTTVRRGLFLPAVSIKMDLSLFAGKFLCQPRADVCENLFRRGFWR